MGCDIHLFIEKREGDGAPWEPVSVSYPCSGRPDSLGRHYEYCDCSGSGTETGYRRRYYKVFAALADVRNDGDIKPIAEPRGLPKDLSDELRSLNNEHEALGEHSFSWLTLRELNEYDWAAESADDRFRLSDAHFVTGFVPALRLIGHPDHVRIVFGFDS